MNNRLLFVISSCLALLMILTAFKCRHHPSPPPSIQFPRGESRAETVAPMPVVTENVFCHLASGGAPHEQRDERYKKWLAVSVKIGATGCVGSGTIVYHDPRSGYAYVQSCGHLWNGSMAYEKDRSVPCKIIVWYKNSTKLSKPISYPAEVLWYSNTRGQDSSLIRFKPDWKTWYIPIASSDFNYKKDMRLHSTGCDGGDEVAHYDVRYLGTNDRDAVTTENSPRPGRSGGGLMTDDYYVGICWGTTDMSGEGNGLFTPVSVVRQMNAKNGFAWLNEIGILWARKLPIIDRNNSQGHYPEDYIPVPEE